MEESTQIPVLALGVAALAAAAIVLAAVAVFGSDSSQGGYPKPRAEDAERPSGSLEDGRPHTVFASSSSSERKYFPLSTSPAECTPRSLDGTETALPAAGCAWHAKAHGEPHMQIPCPQLKDHSRDGLDVSSGCPLPVRESQDSPRCADAFCQCDLEGAGAACTQTSDCEKGLPCVLNGTPSDHCALESEWCNLCTPRP